MGMARYRYTGGTYASAHREMHHAWAAAWTEAIDGNADGLDHLSRHEVYRIVHEIRRRVEAGDYGPPLAYPQPSPHPQAELELRR